MYKVLITTKTDMTAIGQSPAVHTVVVEFNSNAEAQNAVKVVNEQSLSSQGYRQRAILLYPSR